jgi:hypothetical protein
VQATNGNHSHDRSAHGPQVVLQPHLDDQVGVGVVLLKPFSQFGQPARVTHFTTKKKGIAPHP